MTLIVTLAVYFHEPLYVPAPKTQQPQTIADSNGDDSGCSEGRGIVLSDVEAAILPNMKGDHILLGMSFLKNLSIKQDTGQITMTQKN
jgi:hypothetical protein